MKKSQWAWWPIFIIFLTSFHPFHRLCSGIVEENDLYIPPWMIASEQGVTEAEFHAVLDKIESYYQPIVQHQGARLSVNRLWRDGRVNASANQFGSYWQINMYGGLARHPTMTRDGFMLVACHEMGHHVGGAPKHIFEFRQWASIEGQADYYGTLKCLRFLMSEDENREFVLNNVIPTPILTACQDAYSTTSEQDLCIRSTMAGVTVTKFFQVVKEETETPDVTTPDPTVTPVMITGHPATQCRLDTYFNGALCNQSPAAELSDTFPEKGTCYSDQPGFPGARPFCWFKAQ